MVGKLHPVTMKLRSQDLADIEFIRERYGLCNEATAVATALGLARQVVEHVTGSRKLLVCDRWDNPIYKIVMERKK